MRGSELRNWHSMAVHTLLAACVILPVGLVGQGARATAQISDQTRSLPLGKHLLFRLEVDPNANHTQASATADWRLGERDLLNLGFSAQTVWLRTTLVNRSPHADWYLELAYPPLDDITLWIGSPGQLAEQRGGRAFPFAHKSVRHRNHVFRVNLAPGQSTDLYLRIKSDSSLTLPITLWRADAFLDYVNTSNYSQGLYFGIMFVLVGYNLFLFLTLRELSYLYYSAYIVCFAAFFAALNGMGSEYLFSDWPEFWGVARVLLIGGTGIFLILFTRQFLDTHAKHRRLDYVLLGMIAFFAGLIISIAFLPIAPLNRIVTVLAGLMSTTLLGIGIWSAFSGYRPAYFYLLAFVAILFGAATYSMRTVGLLPDYGFADYALQIGSAVEGILLSFALADRINIIKKEKESAQRQLLDHQIILTDSYARFLPAQFLHLLKKSHVTDVALGDAVQIEMSVLFSDVRSFTTIAESMSPKENFDFLNGLTRRTGPLIREHGGYVDKYIGDAIMALFPRQADDAVQAAVRIKQMLADYNGHRRTRGFEPIRIGIGINTGDVMLGTVGEPNRMDGTCISKAVNLAERTEGLTKFYETTILMTQQTLVRLLDPTAYAFRLIDRVRVKGVNEPVSIFEVFDGDEADLLASKRETQGDFEHGVQYYQNRDFDAAGAQFERVLAANPADRPAAIYLHRSRTLARLGVPSDWDGIADPSSW